MTTTARPRKKRSEAISFLQRLWVGERPIRPKLGRLVLQVVGAALLLGLAIWSQRGAVHLGSWPAPIKQLCLVLGLAAGGALVGAGLLAGRAIYRLGLRRLLILMALVCLVALCFSVLNAGRGLPFFQRVWLATRQGARSTWMGLRDAGWAVARAPGDVLFAYRGWRRPYLPPGERPEDDSYLTPIPVGVPGEKADAGALPGPTREPDDAEAGAPPTPGEAGVPTATVSETSTAPVDVPSTATPSVPGLQPPACPHAQARLVAPRVNEVFSSEISFEGSAAIERFGYYKIEFKREDVEDEWHWAASYEQPVEDGVLGTLPISHLPDGVYTFRLVVVDVQGNYPFPPCEVRVQIRH